MQKIIKHIYIWLVVVATFNLTLSCVKIGDDMPEPSLLEAGFIHASFESAATKANLALGSADGYNNPEIYIEPLTEEEKHDSIVFPFRDPVFERQTKVDVSSLGVMSWTMGDQIAYCVTNGSTNQYVTSTVDVTRGGHFGKRTARRYAVAFGFNETFLLTGRGRLTVRRSGYQKLVQEVESLRNVISEQNALIEKLKAERK